MHRLQSFGRKFWVTQINTGACLSVDHIDLWEMLQRVHLDPNTRDHLEAY
jgi:hypothetical protein